MSKSLEIWGRRLLVVLLGWALGVRPRAIDALVAPRILVVRLDERLGNLLLLTPTLAAARRLFPEAHIDLLAHVRGRALLASHPAIDRFLAYRKWAVFAADGPLRTVLRLRRQRYAVAIDASNPTDPSATQAIVTRLCGARHTVGVDRPAFGRLYSSPVRLADLGAHEIDLRLQLLAPLLAAAGCGDARTFTFGAAPAALELPALGALPALAPGSAVARLLAAQGRGGEVAAVDHPAKAQFAVLNVGARLRAKHLDPESYAQIGRCLLRAPGWSLLITYGPSDAERVLAEQTRTLLGDAPVRLAPPTDVIELVHLFAAARGVVTCDTGPMHLAVAVGTPTAGIFVSTDPTRYGYDSGPHTRIDARQAPLGQWLGELSAWCDKLAKRQAG